MASIHGASGQRPCACVILYTLFFPLLSFYLVQRLGNRAASNPPRYLYLPRDRDIYEIQLRSKARVTSIWVRATPTPTPTLHPAHFSFSLTPGFDTRIISIIITYYFLFFFFFVKPFSSLFIYIILSIALLFLFFLLQVEAHSLPPL